MSDVKQCDKCRELYAMEEGVRFTVGKYRKGWSVNPYWDEKVMDLCPDCSPVDDKLNPKRELTTSIVKEVTGVDDDLS